MQACSARRCLCWGCRSLHHLLCLSHTLNLLTFGDFRTDVESADDVACTVVLADEVVDGSEIVLHRLVELNVGTLLEVLALDVFFSVIEHCLMSDRPHPLSYHQRPHSSIGMKTPSVAHTQQGPQQQIWRAAL